jgi:UDP-glucose 4-epimerase
MAKSIDLGNYYQIPCDDRDLNYDKYFVEGVKEIAHIEAYHSHNTQRLDIEEMKKLLLKLPMVRRDILGEEI